MKHCQQCNLDFPHGFRFCGSCGGGLSDSITCESCGEVVDGRWKFCTTCGTALAPSGPLTQSEAVASPRSAAPSAQVSQTVGDGSLRSTFPLSTFTPLQANEQQTLASTPVREWYAAPELLEESDETTMATARACEIFTSSRVNSQSELAPSTAASQNGSRSRNGKDVPTLTMLSAYGQQRIVATEPVRRYPILLGVAMTLFFAAVGFGGWYVWSHRASAAAAAQTQPTAANELSLPSAGETPAERTKRADGADYEWKRLREQRIAAQPSERDAITASIEAAEKKFLGDYRFPYERAKLSIKGIVSHHEAFNALGNAAEKAIDNAQTQDMLDSLSADKDGDFWKLARGHHEWTELIDALTNKDKRHLSELHH